MPEVLDRRQQFLNPSQDCLSTRILDIGRKVLPHLKDGEDIWQ